MSDMNNNFPEDELDIKETFSILWNKKKLIIYITSAFALFSVILALLLPNVYTSSTLLAPTKADNSLSSQLNQLSSLASMTGINIPVRSNSRSREAVARIQSFEFFSKYFLPNVSLENVVAAKRWNASDNTIVYQSKFDPINKKWTDKVPSEQKAFELYLKAITVYVDPQSSFVTVSIEHKSPVIAKEWLDIIIYNLNESMRMEDIQLSQSYIDFLNSSQQSTNIQSLRDSTSRLLENQMQTLMLASSNKDYIFKTLNSPIVPELKSGPPRAIICIAITLFGGILSVLIVLMRHHFFFRKEEKVI